MIQIRTILVPTDFTPCSQRAVAYAAALAARFDAEVVLVHAIEAPLNLPPHTLVHIDAQGLSMPIMDYVREAAERRMGAALEELTLAKVRARSVVEVGDVRDVALAQAERLPADLIVMGTNGRTGLRHLLIGSVAEDIVRRAPVPVLTIRVPEEDKAPVEAVPVPAT
ncbi:MAG: universal stress protein [Polyangiales bacterium]